MSVVDAAALSASAARILGQCELGSELHIDAIRIVQQSVQNCCLLVTTSAGRFLIKQTAAGQQSQKLVNQYIAVALAIERGVPTPAIRHFSSICSGPDGTSSVMVFDYEPGCCCQDTFDDFSDGDRQRLFADLGLLLARVHRHAAFGFSEKLDGVEPATLAQVVQGRLEYCFAQSAAFVAVNPRELAAARQKLRHLLDAVAPLSKPVLIHGDAGLRNLIEREHRLVALIDFEHAKFHDAAYDFVKLWLSFGTGPYWEVILHSYRAAGGELAAFEQRLALALGLEILSGLAYFHRTRDPAMYGRYQAWLTQWLMHTQ